MAHKWAKINVSGIVYQKDTNNDYVKDTNDDRVVLEDNYLKIASTDDYEANVDIEEYYYPERVVEIITIRYNKSWIGTSVYE